MRKILVILFLTLILCPMTVGAQEYEELEEIIPSEVKEVLDEIDVNSIDTESAVSLSGKDIISAIIPNIKKDIKAPVKALSGIFCILLLSALLNILKRNDMGKVYDIAAAAICAICVLSPVCDVVTEINAAIAGICNFMYGYIPIYTGIIATCGTPTAALSYSGLTLTACEVFSLFSQKLILPAIGMVLGLSALSTLSSNELFSKLPEAAKSASKWIFATAVSVFVMLLIAKNAIAAASDSMIIKSGKMFAGFVPVVGSSLSDAFSVTVGSMNIIKSGTGIFGIVIILILYLPSLIKLLIWIFGVKFICFSAESVGTQGMKRVLKGVSDALEMLLAVYISLGVVFFISTALMLQSGGTS